MNGLNSRALVIWLMTAGVVAATPDSSRASEKVNPDVKSYAALMNIDEGEAERRLAAQARLGWVENELRSKAGEIFAGLWIEHKPELAVEIRFTDLKRGEELLASMTQKLAGIQVRTAWAELSLAELEKLQQRATNQARAAGVPVDSDIDLRGNRVELQTTNAALLANNLNSLRAQNPDKLALVEVGQLAQPAQAQPLRGGRPLSTCTSGFTVRNNSTGQVGVLTAGHCGNSQTYLDTWDNLPFMSERYSGNHDIQWHNRSCNLTVPNEFDAGNGIRQVTGTQHRDQQAINSYICKNGMTTGRTCGFITSKSICPSYVPSCSSTFIRAREANYGIMVQPGDSGGAWYVENIAYGITSGYYPSNGDGIYMAINYISTLGVSVLTYNGGTGSMWPSVYCSPAYAGATQVDCSASINGGVGPYTYQWYYYGNASSWGSSSNWAWATYDWLGCPEGGINDFTVQVTDSCGQTGYGYGSSTCQSCGPYYFCPQL